MTKKQTLASLNYVDTTKKGYKRIRADKKFAYKNTRGDLIKDKRILQRIESLVIPPAWRRVWICTDPKGHIQCFGYDDRNRRQYIYHPNWSEQRSLRKFRKINGLATVMNELTRQINKDMKVTAWNKEKVCALALAVTKETLMRVGNAKYTKENKSYGLTTLKKAHITFQARSINIDYIGKKGIKQVHQIRNTRLYRYLYDLYQIPGDTMFRYYSDDASASLVRLKPKDINGYLQKCCDDQKITVKSFRIWGASVSALQSMIRIRKMYEKSKAQTLLIEILDKVAVQLGNTRTVAKKYYVHPILQDLFISGKIYKKIDTLKLQDIATRKQAERLFQKLI